MKQRALIIGSSGGIGHALSVALERRNFEVSRLSRSMDGLDITNEADLEKHLRMIAPEIDLVIVATGILSFKNGPEKSIRNLASEEMSQLFAVNAIGPALVLKHVMRLLPRDRRAVFAALSARVGSIGDNRLGGWYSYRASKAALNQMIRTASIELRRTHKNLICVAVHPGTVATQFTRNYRQYDAVQADVAATNILQVLDDLTPIDSGGFFDWSGESVPW